MYFHNVEIAKCYLICNKLAQLQVLCQLHWPEFDHKHVTCSIRNQRPLANIADPVPVSEQIRDHAIITTNNEYRTCSSNMHIPRGLLHQKT